MKRGTKCIAQTINLSNPKTCVRPKVQRLVGPDVDPRSESDRVTDYWIARPVAVKVCSRKDVQQKCMKIHAACPVKKPLSSGQRLCGIAMFFLKGAIAAGLVYWTWTEGFWGDSSETEDLYCRIISVIFPTDQPVRLPHLEGIRYSMSEAYNRALVRCMDIIVSVPLEMHRKLRDLLFPCDVTGGTEEAEEREAHLTS